MIYKDWIKVGQMTDEEVLNDIELLVGALKGEYSKRTDFEAELQATKNVTLGLQEENNTLAYENKNMAEFLKYNDKTLTDSDVGDIATSTIKSGVWDRFRTNAQFDRDGTLLSELPVSDLWSDNVWDRFKVNNNKGDK
jgi:hypothetical protein